VAGVRRGSRHEHAAIRVDGCAPECHGASRKVPGWTGISSSWP
jgi:hypothetical protein